jgi:hypothetical protein
MAIGRRRSRSDVLNACQGRIIRRQPADPQWHFRSHSGSSIEVE